MKHVLIISPHFPPVNAADMHRIRQTLPFLEQNGWLSTVVAVNPKYVETSRDPLLAHTVPNDQKIVWVEAFSTRWTRKLGLGSLALRSIWFYWRKVNRMLQQGGIDLVYFSTTQFPLLILGNYWKKRFGVPYIIDMQDPWHSDYYQSKPKHEQPPKYWFSYRLNKWLEPIAMRRVDALIAVSGAYIDTLRERYPHLRNVPGHTLTFGAYKGDFEVLKNHPQPNPFFRHGDGCWHWVYAGAAGHIMHKSLDLLFEGVALGLKKDLELFSRIRFHFVGTNYAPNGSGKPTVQPIAKKYGVENYVKETTDRIPYFQALQLMQDADFLLILGSDDPNYSASKIYPSVLARKPLLAFIHAQSNAVGILNALGSFDLVTYTIEAPGPDDFYRVYQTLKNMILRMPYVPEFNQDNFLQHQAEAKSKAQVDIFNSIVS